MRALSFFAFSLCFAAIAAGQIDVEDLDPDKCYIQINVDHDTVVTEFPIPLPRHQHQLKTKKKKLLVCGGVNTSYESYQIELDDGGILYCWSEGPRGPGRYETIEILKRPKKVNQEKYSWQTFTYLKKTELHKYFIPVACQEKLTSSLFLKISEQLYVHGYAKDYGETALSEKLQDLISAFEQEQCLPAYKGYVSLLTLEALEINIEK